MNIHKNARLTPYRRGELVARAARGEPVAGLARLVGEFLLNESPASTQSIQLVPENGPVTRAMSIYNASHRLAESVLHLVPGSRFYRPIGERVTDTFQNRTDNEEW